MQQHLEIRDNFGNRGTLTFHYKEDKPVVVNAICKLKAEGKYPEKLWEE